MIQLNKLADAGNTVIVVEHDMQVIAQSDWVIDIGPGAGEEGGKIVYSGLVQELTECKESRTAPFLSHYLAAR
jgi:excinuclease ABC subunit A